MAYRNSTQLQNWKVLKYKTFSYIAFISTPLTSQYSGTLLLRRLGCYLTLFLLFPLLLHYICEFSNSNALRKTIWLFWIFTMQYWGSLLGSAFTKVYTIDLWPGSSIIVLILLGVVRLVRSYDTLFSFNLEVTLFL